MRKIVGLAFAAFVAGACGHEQTTGSAQNGWNTPVGHASATNPRYINPMAPMHAARDRSFEERQAPPMQSPSSETLTPSDQTVPMTTEPPPGPLPPPAETMPPPETVPETAPSDVGPGLGGPPDQQRP